MTLHIHYETHKNKSSMKIHWQWTKATITQPTNIPNHWHDMWDNHNPQDSRM